MSARRACSVLVGAIVCLSACSSAAAPQPTPSATTDGWPWRVQADVRYATADDYYLPALADVYAPPSPAGAPVVVILHEGSMSKDDVLYQDLAAAMVEKGAVVVVPNWGPLSPGADLEDHTPVEQVIAHHQHNDDQIVCALAFAAATATQLGADPSRLAVLGHGGAANFAATAAWLPTRPLPGCSVDPVLPDITGMLLWEGDWVGGATSTWLGADTAAVVEDFTPWPRLDQATITSAVVLARGDNNDTNFVEAHVNAVPDWMAMRDRTGRMQAALDRVDAFEDDKVTIFEVTDAFHLALSDHGTASRVVVFTDPGTDHTLLAPADFRTTVDEAIALTARD